MLEFSDKVIGTVTVQKQITESDIENIVVTADCIIQYALFGEIVYG